MEMQIPRVAESVWVVKEKDVKTMEKELQVKR